MPSNAPKDASDLSTIARTFHVNEELISYVKQWRKAVLRRLNKYQELSIVNPSFEDLMDQVLYATHPTDIFELMDSIDLDDAVDLATKQEIEIVTDSLREKLRLAPVHKVSNRKVVPVDLSRRSLTITKQLSTDEAISILVTDYLSRSEHLKIFEQSLLSELRASHFIRCFGFNNYGHHLDKLLMYQSENEPLVARYKVLANLTRIIRNIYFAIVVAASNVILRWMVFEAD